MAVDERQPRDMEVVMPGVPAADLPPPCESGPHPRGLIGFGFISCAQTTPDVRGMGHHRTAVGNY